MNPDLKIINELREHRAYGVRLLIESYARSINTLAMARVGNAPTANRLVDLVFFSYFDKDVSELHPPLRHVLHRELLELLFPSL